MKEDKLFVFFHIPKCGGTTVNTHIKYNFKKEEGLYLCVGQSFYDIKKKKYVLLKDRNQIVEYLESLTKDEKEKIKVIYGHAIFYGIHKYFDKIPFYFTFFRDPFTREVSQFNQKNRAFRQKNSMNFHGIGHIAIKNDIKLTSFEEHCKKSQNLLRNTLIKRHFLKESSLEEKENIIKDLKRLDFIGTIETFNEDFLFLSYILNFKNFFDKKNVSKESYVTLSPNQITKIKEHFIRDNKTDYELYNIIREINKKAREENEEFEDIIKKQERKMRKRVFVSELKRKAELLNQLVKMKLKIIS